MVKMSPKEFRRRNKKIRKQDKLEMWNKKLKLLHSSISLKI